MKELVTKLLLSDDGQDLIEYGLLVGVITIGAIVAITAIGPPSPAISRAEHGAARDAIGFANKRRTQMNAANRARAASGSLAHRRSRAGLVEYALLTGIAALAAAIALPTASALGDVYEAWNGNIQDLWRRLLQARRRRRRKGPRWRGRTRGSTCND